MAWNLNNPKEQAEYGIELALARRKYEYYFTLSHENRYKLYPHVKLICSYLQRIINGEKLFLCVEMPPRHGKSASITETFPSYYLMKNPDKEVMMAAYSEDLYTKFGRKNRDKFMVYAPQMFGLQLSQQTSSVSDWGVKGHSGGMYSTSILSGATGRGADLLIIDDPIKNAQEAMSKTIRDKIWEEWQSTFSTRLHADSSCIVIMTRWSDDDLIGRLLKQKARPWIELKLPAVCTETDDLLGREIGDTLAPQKPLSYDKVWAEQTKKSVGARTWAALYQQNPIPEGGGVFKPDWLRYYVPNEQIKHQLGLDDSVAILPRFLDTQVQSWDATFKSKENDDYVAGQVWGARGADRYLLHREHARMDFTQTLNAIRRVTKMYPKASRKFIEDKANGPAIINTLQHEIGGIIPVEPQGGKEVRAYAVTAQFEAGNIYIPHPAWRPEIDDYITELTSFPTAAHDDEVDSTTQGLTYMEKSNNLFARYGM